jgi:hypothetical protein
LSKEKTDKIETGEWPLRELEKSKCGFTIAAAAQVRQGGFGSMSLKRRFSSRQTLS